MNNIFKIGFLLLILFTLVSCDSYLDPGPQPTELINVKFEPGFNIFGVLRVDGTSGSSFVHVERAYRIEENDDEDFEPMIENAEVLVTELESGAETEFDTYDYGYLDNYVNSSFVPQINKIYSVKINNGELPELTGTTRIPPLPEVDSTSIEIIDNHVEITIVHNAEIYMYDVVFVTMKDDILYGFNERVFITNAQNKEVAINLDPEYGELVRIEVFAYDENLALYLNSSNTLKPQTYQETTTTVNGGYGCFGSVTRTAYDIPF